VITYYLGYTFLATFILPMKWISGDAVTAFQVAIYLMVLLAIAALWRVIQYTEDAAGRRDAITER
jgi:presenilin-like A22 family membrane protease